MKKTIVMGYPSLDYILKVNKPLRVGQTSIIENSNSKMSNFGGCSVNIAYLLAHLDNQVDLAIRVGNDFQTSNFKDFLEKKSIGLDKIIEISNAPTSYTQLVMMPSGEHVTLFHPGAMSVDYHRAFPSDLVDNYDYAVITVGEPRFSNEFVDQCIVKGVPLIFSMKADFDSMPIDYINKVMHNSELIFMNESEYEILNQELPCPVMSYLNTEVTKVIVITKGAEGSVIYYRDINDCIVNCYVPCVSKVYVRDTSGGGDAYIAGFLNSYFNGKKIKECGERASVLSSFIIEDYGCLTNIPTIEEFEERYLKNYIGGVVDE